MDLWSKGLGRRVLSLSLAERQALETRDTEFVMSGVMHAPTFWDYEVTLDRQDVVEFLELLQRPDVVRFVAVDEQRTAILRTAVTSAAVFAVRTLGLLVRRPRPMTDAPTPDNERASHGRT
jgi:hypothetical protein